MCIFRLGVYDIGRFILFVYFFVGSGVGWVVYLVSVYLVFILFWEVIDVYTEIPRVFWALGILFIYRVGRGILDLLGSEVYPVGMGLSLGYYTGLGT